ncbi:hypothetical protein [Paraconexibacter algicola]|uniref:Uncharacterized protein n=1 Tax=Paraconexibacter algicola TaxID=2133960 RepID=A0A2T4UJI0_9ACTN|nr:hypothetical protein [Paraconexibacter algicola]PTL59392.1 hypothetical protein C7Y72_06870 [Paraconexibacter algicola]
MDSTRTPGPVVGALPRPRPIIATLIALVVLLVAPAAVQAAQGWQTTTTAPMSTARSYHVQTTLGDGRVLVAGGIDSAAASGGEVYDPATNQWTATGPLAASRYGAASILLGTGPTAKVLVVGGRQPGSGTSRASAELYDPATNAWTATPTVPHAHGDPILIPLSATRIMAISAAGVDVYDTTLGTWDDAGTPPAAAALTELGAVKLQNGKVLVYGGSEFTPPFFSTVKDTAHVFTPPTDPNDTGSWALVPNGMVVARSRAPGTLLNDGRVFISGGYSGESLGGRRQSTEIYDPATNSFTAGPSLGSLRHLHTQTLLSDGSVLVAGGQTDNNNTSLSSSDLYTPATGAIGTIASGGTMNGPRQAHGVSALPGGKLLLTGGTGNGSTNSSTEVYQDGSPPTATLTAPADGAVFTRDQVVTSSFACASTTSTIASGGCALVVAHSSGTPTVTQTTSGGALPTAVAGDYSATLTATDANGLTATTTADYAVAAPPTATITAPAGETVALDATLTADFACAADTATTLATTGGCVASVSGPTVTATAVADGDTLPTAAAGTYTLTVTATDALGQTTTETATYTATDGPAVQLTSPAPNAVFARNQAATLTYTCTAAATAVVSCGATVTPPGGSATPLPSGSALPTTVEGVHAVEVLSTDTLGQVSTVTRTYRVVAPPTATITAPTNDLLLKSGAGAVAEFACASATSTIASCVARLTNPAGTETTVAPGAALPTVVAGRYTLRLTATDAVGQTASATVAYTVAAPPTVRIDAPAERAAFQPGDRATASFACASAASTVSSCAAKVQPPSGDLVTVENGGALPTGTAGTYTIVATATDALGQTSTTSRQYLVAVCEKRVAFGLVEITTNDCFARSGSEAVPRYETTSAVTVNGVPLPAPPSGQRFTAIAPSQGRPGGRIQLSGASIKVGSLTVYNGDIGWDLPAGGEGDEKKVATLAVPTGTTFQGLKVPGSADIRFGLRGGTYYSVFTLNIGLPEQFTTMPGGGGGSQGVTGQGSIRVDRNGVRYDGMMLHVRDIYLGKLKVDEACLSFVPAGSSQAVAPCPAPELNGEPYIECPTDSNTARWNGNAKITLPTEAETELAIFGGLADGQVSSFGGFVNNLGTSVPLATGVYLNQIGVGLCLKPPPFKLKGSVGVSILPAGKKDTIALNGAFTYTDSTPDSVWSVQVEGDVVVLGTKVGGGGVTYRPNGLIDFYARAALKFSVLSVEGRVDGFLDTRAKRFNIDGQARICVAPLCAEALAVLSNIGAAGCVTLGTITIPYPWLTGFPPRYETRYKKIPLKAGAGVKWSGGADVWGGSCDLDSYRVERPTARAAQAGQLTFGVAGGQPANSVRLTGRDAPPSVTLTGPGGTTFTSPTDGSGYKRTDDFILVENPEDKTTSILMIKPKAGRWTVTAGPGPEGAVSIETADYSPPASFKGSVTSTKSKGTKRLELLYSLDEGSNVQIVEESADGRLTGTLVERLTGTRCGKGVPSELGGVPVRCASVAFTPTEGPGGPRAVSAVVTNAAGMPRERVRLATYIAPDQVLPSRPQRVRIRRTAKNKVVVTWSRSTPAIEQMVSLKLSDGRQFGVSLKRCSSFVLHGVPAGVAVEARIAGRRADSELGTASQTLLKRTAKTAGWKGKDKPRTCRPEFYPGGFQSKPEPGVR